MKVTSLDVGVLTGQGGTGSFGITLPNPAPGIGPTSGDAGSYDVAVPIANPGNDNLTSEAGEPLPPHIDSGGPPALAAPAPSVAMPAVGGSSEPTSQYSTQGPIPKG